MKMTNASIINVINILNGYMDKRLPQKINYAISRNHSILNKEYKMYFESLEKLLKNYEEYYEKDEDGNVKINEAGLPVIGDEHMGDFTEELAELLSVEIDINLHYIDIEAFDYDDQKYDVLSSNDIRILSGILCEE